ncbi:MAG: DUF192 domain-containing protein [Patescibacteria group bacterium]|nr:DUF192 domain-containing protein [Patescibacteria group bacterium]
MNKRKIIFIVALFCVCFCFYCFNIQKKDSPQKETVISEVCFGEKCFNVEIADTPETRAQGLMDRKHLNPDSGMLFLFDTEAEYSFWMKNTLIPLDIIWLDKNKKVVFVKHTAQPCETNPCETFGSSKKAKYILELNGGLAREIKLKEGDYLEFN